MANNEKIMKIVTATMGVSILAPMILQAFAPSVPLGTLVPLAALAGMGIGAYGYHLYKQPTEGKYVYIKN